MKIELEAKPGYEWVEVSRAKWLDSPEEQTSAVWRQSGDINRYFLLQPIKPKYDYSDLCGEDLLALQETLLERIQYVTDEPYLDCKAKLDCWRQEVLRRLDKED